MSNAAHIALHCLAADDAGYVVERYAERFPKADVGKSCIRFKKLADLDDKALASIKETAKTGYGV